MGGELKAIFDAELINSELTLVALLRQNDRENALVDLQNEQRQAYAKLVKLQCEVSAHLRASQKKSGQVKDEDPVLSDFSDVYDKLEEEPAKVSVILKRVSKDLLEDLDSFIRRRIEAFSAIGGQSLDKELEVSNRTVERRELAHANKPITGTLSSSSGQGLPHCSGQGCACTRRESTSRLSAQRQ